MSNGWLLALYPVTVIVAYACVFVAYPDDVVKDRLFFWFASFIWPFFLFLAVSCLLIACIIEVVTVGGGYLSRRLELLILKIMEATDE